MEVPSIRTINESRIRRFNDRITETLKTADVSFFKKMVDDYCAKNDAVREDVAAAVAHILQGDVPMLLQKPVADQKPAPRKKANDQRPVRKKSKRPTQHRRPAA
jgi:ATP-dependent RNA helicase DeaD